MKTPMFQATYMILRFAKYFFISTRQSTHFQIFSEVTDSQWGKDVQKKMK